MDDVFRALADPTRRRLLDELFKEDGQTLSALEERLPMTRFGVMKHLKILEEAGLVTTKRRGRGNGPLPDAPLRRRAPAARDRGQPARLPRADHLRPRALLERRHDLRERRRRLDVVALGG